MTASGSRATALLDRGVPDPNGIRATSDVDWFGDTLPGMAPVSPHGTGTSLQERPVAIGAPYHVSTEDVLDVLGPDADDLLSSTQLDVEGLVEKLNAETMLLPRIDAEFEAEIEEALAGASEDDEGEPPKIAEVATAVAASPKWKKRFLRAAIGAVLLAATGGATAMAMNKSVTVDIDGHDRTVNTFDSTVGQVLEDEGIAPGAHDVLSPSPNASISDGGKIVLERGRQLHLKIDGVEQDKWTHETTVGAALRDLNIKPPKGAVMSVGPNDEIPLNGMTIAVKTRKHVTLVDGTHAPKQIDTNAVTVGEFLDSQHIKLGKDDSVSPGLQKKLTDDAQVLVSRTGVSVINEKRQIDPPVKKIEDSSMLDGKKQIVEEGKAGEKVITYRVTKVNGKETERDQLGVKVISKPEQKVVKVGTKQPAMSNEAMWDRIASCESGGDWHTNTGNGYYGGLQFDRQTWQGNGGGQYAPTADKATKAQQIQVANRVKASRGLSPWQCAREMGMA